MIVYRHRLLKWKLEKEQYLKANDAQSTKPPDIETEPIIDQKDKLTQNTEKKQKNCKLKEMLWNKLTRKKT